MAKVKRKVAKTTAAKQRTKKRAKSTTKTNRTKTAKKVTKKRALSPGQKAAATRKANAEKAKRSEAAKKAAKTRKANANAKSKKTTTKGATKKRTATKKTEPRKRKHVDGRSREARAMRGSKTYVKECAKLLLRGKFTDAQIRDKLAALFGGKYSGAKHTRHIRKYRSLLNSGGLEDVGFARPPKPVQEVGRTAGAEEAGLSKRGVRKLRRAIREKKGVGPRARFARRRRLQSSVSSPGADTTGPSSDDAQPTARRARRR
jgi:hypothetical protein